ncbi:MAG: hypothetical protein HQK54_17285 [Oligoflexales bacterium]|nr:hypothetical protein [Oligoflexales bacterium]
MALSFREQVIDTDLNPIQGAIPAWKNLFSVMSWPEWLQFDPIREAGKISAAVILIHSEEAAIPGGAKKFFDKLVSAKEFHWIKGTQFDFYDNPQTVIDASKKVIAWFKEHLK